ncbi:MAG: lysylphosphatidylglycerol synthase transmembrane domain-containing protein [Paracoccaceae bacterium]
MLADFVIKYRGWLVRLLGSALLLGVIFWFLPLADVATAFASISPTVFLSVLCLFVVAHIAAALKWWLLLDRGLPMIQAIRAHFAGLAANLCLPGAAGGDVVRAGMAQAVVKDGSRIVAVSVVDRLIDMLALLALAGVGFVLSGQSEQSTVMVIRAGGVLLAVVAGFMALPWLLPLPWKLVPKLPGRSLADKFGGAIKIIGKNPGLLALLLAFSMTIQMVLVSLSWWLALGVGADVSLGQWMFAWPLAKVIAVLPISLNGLGLREAALAANLSGFGASAALIVAAGLVWQAVLYIAGGIGAVVLALSSTAVKIPEN